MLRNRITARFANFHACTGALLMLAIDAAHAVTGCVRGHDCQHRHAGNQHTGARENRSAALPPCSFVRIRRAIAGRDLAVPVEFGMSLLNNDALHRARGLRNGRIEQSPDRHA
jgi:hypothetical protein